EMSDEMPAHRRRGRIHLGKRFLHPILPDVAKPGVVRRLNGIRAVRLGDRHDRDGLSVTAAAPRCLDSIAHLSKPFREVRKRHKTPSYRKLQSESREASWTLADAGSSTVRGQERTFTKYSFTGSVDGRTSRP